MMIQDIYRYSIRILYNSWIWKYEVGTRIYNKQIYGLIIDCLLKAKVPMNIDIYDQVCGKKAKSIMPIIREKK